MRQDAHAECGQSSQRPERKTSSDGAFSSFIQFYHPVLTEAHLQIDMLIASLPEHYAEGYRAWRDMIVCLKNGVESVARGQAPHHAAMFEDALHSFSMDGAVHLLFDLVDDGKDMGEMPAHFRMHILRLIEVYQTLPFYTRETT